MGRNSNLCLIATSILLLCAMAFSGTASASVGTVTNLSGPLFGKKPDGASRTLSVNSAVEENDTLISEKRTYGRVKFTDGGEITLRPGTTFVVEKYFFDKNKPADDTAVFGLVKGSLRAVTGQVSKRGSPDAYKMKTFAATIGVRGTAFDLKICDDNCPGLANGIYFLVIEGMIEVSNKAGSRTFSAGEYGYVKDFDTKPEQIPFLSGIGFDMPPFENDICGVR